jgi:hypothetical protein
LEEENVPLPDFDIKTTISSKFSSFIEFLRGGIQLLPLFDLISIFIIFQYVFGLDECDLNFIQALMFVKAKMTHCLLLQMGE